MLVPFFPFFPYVDLVLLYSMEHHHPHCHCCTSHHCRHSDTAVTSDNHDCEQFYNLALGSSRRSLYLRCILDRPKLHPGGTLSSMVNRNPPLPPVSA